MQTYMDIPQRCQILPDKVVLFDTEMGLFLD